MRDMDILSEKKKRETIKTRHKETTKE